MISIIIPTLDEAIALPETLAQVTGQRGGYEIIVVDGGSTDGTQRLAREHPGVRLISATRGRASQMNAGARQASGEWLLFLHADTLLPPGALKAIAELPDRAQAGGFTHRFSGDARGLRLTSWLHNFRCRRTHVFYGDQAPFIRKSLFFELGGYPNEPILEDLLFGERLAKVTRPVMLDLRVVTDSRKFEQHGVWLSLWRVLAIIVRHELGLPIKQRRFFGRVR